MAGYTDAAFRRICSSLGADFVVSEMISSVALVMSDRKTGELAKITPGEAPVILQLFGHDPETMAKAADLLLSGSFRGCSYSAPPAGIDINMGCPVKKIVTSSDGSALMRDPALASRIASAVKEVCVRYGVPLSVKFRSGWNKDSLNAPEFALAMAESGADRITVHCRTKEQMYAPSADPSMAGKVCRTLREAGYSLDKLEIIGNGDVDSPSSAAVYLDHGCTGVAVGRAALGNPWIFSQLKDPDHFTPPTRDGILETVIRFVEDVVREKGEFIGVRESRGRAACFVKGMRGSARLRGDLNHCETLKDFVDRLEQFRRQDDENAPDDDLPIDEEINENPSIES